MGNVWDDVLPEEDRLVFEKAGWGKEVGFGEKPVLLVVDVIYNFVGDVPEPILESIKRWRYSCGERGWEGV
ncbi:MAG: hydrolase, partial [Solirubrobacterales bacterium]